MEVSKVPFRGGLRVHVCGGLEVLFCEGGGSFFWRIWCSSFGAYFLWKFWRLIFVEVYELFSKGFESWNDMGHDLGALSGSACALTLVSQACPEAFQTP